MIIPLFFLGSALFFSSATADDHKNDDKHRQHHQGQANVPRRNNIARTPSLSNAKTWSTSSNQRIWQKDHHTHGAPPQNQLQTFLTSRPSLPAGGAQLQNFQGTRLFYKDQSLSQKGQQDRNAWGDRIREHVRNRNFNRGNAFNNQFWHRHRYNPSFGYGNWWNGSSWKQINQWVPWGYAAPLYYEGEAPIEIAEQDIYYAEAPTPPPNASWMPLGVFGLLYDLESDTPPTMFFQLAINREGGIAGTYYNQDNDKLYTVYGVVERASQRAVWKIGDQQTTIFQTGLYNLSLSQTPVTVAFANGQTETWYLVRM